MTMGLQIIQPLDFAILAFIRRLCLLVVSSATPMGEAECVGQCLRSALLDCFAEIHSGFSDNAEEQCWKQLRRRRLEQPLD